MFNSEVGLLDMEPNPRNQKASKINFGRVFNSSTVILNV